MTRRQSIVIAARQEWVRFAVLAGAMLAVAAVTHLVPTAVFAGIALLYAVATMVAARAPRHVLRVSAVALATAAVVGSTLLVLSPGDLGFNGVGGDQAYQAIRTAYGFPAGWDPTVFLTRGQIVQPPPAPYGAADILALFENKTVSGWGTKSLPEGAKAAPFALAGLGLILVLALGDRKLRVTGVAFVGLAFLLIGVGVYFATSYRTMVVQHFASRRLTDYWGLPFVVLGIGGVEAALRRIAGPRNDNPQPEVSESEGSEGNSPSRTGRWSSVGRAWRSRRRRIAMALAILFSLTVATWFLPRLIRPPASEDNADRKLALLAWIAKNVPCEGRILADQRTLATFELLTGHAGVLEGMGPHLRPSVLQIAVGELLDADRFFANPTESYLTDRGIAAVVVTGPGLRIGGWHLRNALHEDATLPTVPFLDPVYQAPDATIYLVTSYQPNPNLPRVQGSPGYRCEAADV